MTSRLMSLKEWRFFASVKAAVVRGEVVVVSLEAGGYPTSDGLLSVVLVLLADIRGICDDFEGSCPGFSESTRESAKNLMAQQSIDSGAGGSQWSCAE